MLRRKDKMMISHDLLSFVYRKYLSLPSIPPLIRFHLEPIIKLYGILFNLDLVKIHIFQWLGIS